MTERDKIQMTDASEQTNNDALANSEQSNRIQPGIGRSIGPGIGLSAKLLMLTILFVMISEVLIFVPSIANFRITWLKDRLPAAQIAALVLEAAPDGMIPKSLERELLDDAGAKTIALSRGGIRHLLTLDNNPPDVDFHVDLRVQSVFRALDEAFGTLVASEGRIIRVIGPVRMSPEGFIEPGEFDHSADFIEVIMDEMPLRTAMIRFSFNILSLSIIISGITAALVYLSLNWLLIRPMRHLTRNMVNFSQDPEEAARIIRPSVRSDEIGVAERELAAMQEQLSQTLHHKGRLAALGLAVSKINHDLRNILANSHLISDRLSSVADPTVQRFAPKLIASLDRAVELCTNTIKYGQVREAAPDRRRLVLHPLVEEIGNTLSMAEDGPVVWENDVPLDLEIDADPDQLYRVLMNLLRNATQALQVGGSSDGGPPTVRVTAFREGAVTMIDVVDNGPGVPARAREHLFEAFQSIARPGRHRARVGDIGRTGAYAWRVDHAFGRRIRCDFSHRLARQYYRFTICAHQKHQTYRGPIAYPANFGMPAQWQLFKGKITSWQVLRKCKKN